MILRYHSERCVVPNVQPDTGFIPRTAVATVAARGVIRLTISSARSENGRPCADFVLNLTMQFIECTETRGFV